MRINLLEIPPEGETFICNQNTGELNNDLKDLIGSLPFLTEFTIIPTAGGTFSISGFIRTEVPADCSRCGLDFKAKVDEKFQEILMPSLDQPRNSKYAKANHVMEVDAQGPNVIEYQGHHFEAGEYLHEVIGLTQSPYPAPEEDAKGNCSLCHKHVKGQLFHYDEPLETKKNPFEELKKLKIN